MPKGHYNRENKLLTTDQEKYIEAHIDHKNLRDISTYLKVHYNSVWKYADKKGLKYIPIRGTRLKKEETEFFDLEAFAKKYRY